MSKTIGAVLVLVLTFSFSLLAAADPPTPDKVELKGSSFGSVAFNHKAHTDGGWKCEVCHHGSKSEKPPKEGMQYQACRDCHSKSTAAPMKTKVAFHAVGAKAGVCIDCHVAEKKGPAKCSDCHVKAPKQG
jgi:hypothetical protein